MLEDNPMLSVNVQVWKYFSVVLNRNWRVFIFVAPVCLMNAMQFVYLFRIWGNLATFILNTFYAAAIFNALLRTCLVIKNRNQFEAFLYQFDALYTEIDSCNDTHARGILRQATHTARTVSIFNLTASFCDIIGALFVPLFSDSRVHPFGVAVPGIDITNSPTYEIFYVLQLPSPVVLTAMYMPFVSLFASFAMLGKALLKILQHRLRLLHHLYGDASRSEEQKMEDLRSCIQYYGKIVRYVKNFNSLVTYIIGIEFLLFSTIICSLLFCINILESFTQIIAVIMYILTMLYVLFTYYWQANELVIESLQVAVVAYDMEWYQCSPQFKRMLLLFIMRCQVPLKIMVGNVYPMTLETFQSLLNVSYSYFTCLRGLNDK